jgi:multidrug transporter EmrE-like cation transporter
MWVKVILIALFVSATVAANVSIKRGSASLTLPGCPHDWLAWLLSVGRNGALIFGLLSYAIALVCYIIILKEFELHIATTITAFIFLVLVLVSRFYFGENIPLLRWAGVGIIIIGMLVVAWSRRP